MQFSSNEIVLQILVSNGDRVTKGQKIAVQDQRKLQNKLSSTKSSLEQSYLSLQDELIGRGYSIKDTASVPREEMILLRTKSGYDKAVVEYNTAVLDFQNSALYAPFAGVVANLFGKGHNQIPSSKPFCTIIGDGEFDVAFSISDQLVVPKTAVVLRSGGRDVVFTLKNGIAIWNYIEKGEENSTHIIVKDGLKEDDQVIFSGNMNLAHETNVKIK